MISTGEKISVEAFGMKSTISMVKSMEHIMSVEYNDQNPYG
jgi:hypothetical protein